MQLYIDFMFLPMLMELCIHVPVHITSQTKDSFRLYSNSRILAELLSCTYVRHAFGLIRKAAVDIQPCLSQTGKQRAGLIMNE